MSPRLVETIPDCRAALAPRREAGDSIAFVPTMGYLHEGHLSLLDRARSRADFVVMSIFVNPTQFDSAEDLDAYPRDRERDLRLAHERSVDLVFAPPVAEMYPDASRTTVTMEGLTEGFEGAARPGHFDGVLTVVTKLFNIVQPDIAVFGRKDAQQAAAIRRLIADLDFPIELEIVSTVREPDGLAASSRNVRLSPGERSRALVLYRALRQARETFDEGERDAARLELAMRDVLDEAGGVEVEYAAVVDRDSFAPVAEVERPSLAVIAGRVGAVRLIDNVPLDPRPTTSRDA